MPGIERGDAECGERRKAKRDDRGKASRDAVWP